MNDDEYSPIRKKSSSIKKGWWSFELPVYRPHPKIATYSLFSYDDLPPLQGHVSNDFEWLKSQPIKEDSLNEGTYNNGERPDLGKLSNIIEQIDLQLPKSFTTFIETVDLHKRIQSCTDCYLDVADFAVRTTGEHEGLMIHFLSDSQWCLHWYIHVDNSGNHFVTVSPNAYGFTDSDMDKTNLDLINNDIWFCAPSFMEFIYRFWLENEIWFALTDKKPLTALQQAYVTHYTNSK